MNTFESISKLRGAAVILAAKILGRCIGQIAMGFGDDTQRESEIALYKAIQALHPEDTVTLKTMFGIMMKKANNSVNAPEMESNLSELTPEQKALWAGDASEVSEKQGLINAMPRITQLFTDVPADINAWHDLPVIAQWSLLNKVEATLPQKVSLYKGWADNDTAANKVNTNAMRLHKDAAAAVKPLFKLITAYLADENVATELAAESASGTQVPVRQVA
jgi:hypothetical protein